MDCITVLKKMSGLDLLSITVVVDTLDNTMVTIASADVITPTSTTSVQYLQIKSALALDFCTYPQPKRNKEEPITIYNKKYATKEEKVMTLLACKNWGCDLSTTTSSCKVRMTRAATRLIAYDAGFCYPFGHSNLIALDKILNVSILIGDKFIEEYFSNTRGGKLAYLDMLNEIF